MMSDADKEDQRKEDEEKALALKDDQVVPNDKFVIPVLTDTKMKITY